MKPEPATETQVETYLRRATRGLWGKKRLEVREELAAHLEARVLSYQLAGLGETDAVKRALSELGNPQEVSFGMAKLYTFPKVMNSSLALLAVCLAVVSLWPKGSAQTLKGTSYWPTQECIDSIAKSKLERELSKCKVTSTEFWVSNKALRGVLEPQGVEFKKAGLYRETKVTVPGSNPFFIEESPILSMSGVGAVSRGYLPLWNVIERFSALPTSHVRISGWDDPKIHLNGVSFQLQDENQLIKGNEFYQSYLWAVINEGLDTDFYEEPSGNPNLVLIENFARLKSFQRRASLQVGRSHSDVYGLLTFFELPNPKGRKEATLGFQIARTTKSGEIRVWLPKGETTFVSAFGTGDKLKLGQSILIRLAGSDSQGDGWYEVTSPEKTTFNSAP